jgi:hypothetical protein
MIWHDAIRKNAHRNPFTSRSNQLDKGSVVTILMEHLGLRIAIDDVIADVSY